jgi:hypothetical protein
MKLQESRENNVGLDWGLVRVEHVEGRCKETA